MELKELIAYISALTSGVYFEYKGKSCGIDPLNKTRFDVWYGEKSATMNSIEEVFHAPFFDGKSLTEIFPEIEFDW